MEYVVGAAMCLGCMGALAVLAFGYFVHLIKREGWV